jgi:hypothetical protein
MAVRVTSLSRKTLPLVADVYDPGPVPLVTVTLSTPIRLVSEANQREHWATKHQRKNDQQETLAMMLPLAGRLMRAYGPLEHVVLCRYGKRMDSDNLAGSFKHVQDGIAAWLCRDDAFIKWKYTQVAGTIVGFEARFIMRRVP